jgi:hypothetical protein
VDLAKGDWVALIADLVVDAGFLATKTLPAKTEGFVVDTQTTSFGTKHQARVRFKLDGQDYEQWVDADKLIKTS